MALTLAAVLTLGAANWALAMGGGGMLGAMLGALGNMMGSQQQNQNAPPRTFNHGSHGNMSLDPNQMGPMDPNRMGTMPMGPNNQMGPMDHGSMGHMHMMQH